MPPEETSEELEDVGFRPDWMLMTFICLVNELIDWLGVILNVTGVWAIVIFILNLITLLLVLSWRIFTQGFSFSAVFGGWKGILLLILEHFPVVGDIIPGWFLWMWGIRKKRTPQ